MLRIYNTLTRKIEIFKSIKPKEVRLYTCGPTVYNYAHIGNLRAYIFADILKRYLRYSSLRVKHVMNITDIDDKTIRESRKNNISLKEYTDFYLDAFLNDLKLLNIEIPDIMPRATEHISEIINLVETLENKGYAYRIKGSLYFNISKFKNYGKLSNIKRQTLRQKTKRSLTLNDEYKKEQIDDFVLWKEWRPADGDVFWDTRFGRGRPGWHIECSAMSMKYLGETFDIHTGGIDLIFPHHTNEIAQSESITGKPFVNYWLHNAHLIVNGQKMSKSLNNYYTLRDIQKKGFNLLILRLILLKTHYRQILDFNFDSFKEANEIVKKILNFLIDLDSMDYEYKNNIKNNINLKKKIFDNRIKFEKAMDNDLNISVAIATLFDFINDINKNIKLFNHKQVEEIKNYIFELDKILGFIKIIYEQYIQKIKEILSNEKIKKIINKRIILRYNKNFAASDRIRRELLKENIIIDDLPSDKYIIRLLNFP